MTKRKPPTPFEFEQRIKKIIEQYPEDLEYRHEDLDLYICETMESLGYEDGIRLFRGTPKWYA